MKKMKKTIVVAMAMAMVVLVAALSVPSFAAAPESGSINLDSDKVDLNAGPYCFDLKPYIDVLTFNVDTTVGPYVMYGHLTANYDATVLGLIGKPSFVWAADYPGPEDPSYYAMGFFLMSRSTLDGSMYRTENGDSWVGPTYVYLTPCANSEPSSEGPVSGLISL